MPKGKKPKQARLFDSLSDSLYYRYRTIAYSRLSPASKPKTAITRALDFLSWLPWWANAALAAAGYAATYLASDAALQTLNALPAPTQTGRIPDIALHFAMVWAAAVATAAQLAIPLFFLICAAVSFLRRHKRAGLMQDVMRASTSESLNAMSWVDFERLVGEAFRAQGYSVIETGGGGADGGIDLIVKRGPDKFLVQCKQWRSTRVGVAVVRELYGVMAAQGVGGGFVVTSGRFTQEAHAFARGLALHLIDGPAMFAMIKSGQGRASQGITGMSLVPRQPPGRSAVASKPAAHQQRADGLRPTNGCPQCGGRMVRRTAQKGANAGSEFLGCVQFPVCRGVRKLE